MSNYVFAVGGSGAKMMESLIHLSAAGLLPPERPTLDALLVDPDANNGNGQQCRQVYNAFQACKQLKLGATNLFSSTINLRSESWTPLREWDERGTGRDGNTPAAETLKDIFHYSEHSSSVVEGGSAEADLLDVMFEQQELNMSIHQGFRGRPALGATVLANRVNFDEDPWRGFTESINQKDSQGGARVLMAGSVFGGSGAAGVPTLAQLLHKRLKQNSKARLALILFLPYFDFKPARNESLQADPAAFPMATAEALKYYHERGFLSFCDIYALGEQARADMAISAVGAAEQRNPPHFIELVAAMGAMKFFGQPPSAEPKIAFAARGSEGTLTWADLPYTDFGRADEVRKLQQMAVFAVAYRYIFYPKIVRATRHEEKVPFWTEHVERAKVPLEDAGRAVREVYEYCGHFLDWLLQISSPRREAFEPGMVDRNVFATSNGHHDWRLKSVQEFNDSQFTGLLRNLNIKAKITDRSVYRKACDMKVKDQQAADAGKLIRVLYDACAVE